MTRPFALSTRSPSAFAPSADCVAIHFASSSSIIVRMTGMPAAGGADAATASSPSWAAAIFEHPLEQGLELQPVEDLAHRGDVHRLARQIGRADRQRHVGDEVVEPAVADRAVHLVAQIPADDARDLVGVGQQLGEAAVLGDPA